MTTRRLVGIVYHSEGGHVAALAERIADGARANPGIAVEIGSIRDIPASRLSRFDAIIIGCPTRFGNISAGMKAYLEETLDDWETGALQDRVGASFSVSGGPCGDKALALTMINHFFLMHGMIVVGNPRTGLNSDVFIGAGAKTQQLAKHGALFSTDDGERAAALGLRVARVVYHLQGFR